MDSSLQTDAVLYDIKGSCSTLTLNRPQVGNALNSAMVEALDLAFDRAIQGDARLIVFRGAGRHTCTGFDLSDIETCTDGDLLLRLVRIEQFLQKIYRSPVVTVAIGSGRVYGAGADLLRVATGGSAFLTQTLRFQALGLAWSWEPDALLPASAAIIAGRHSSRAVRFRWPMPRESVS